MDAESVYLHHVAANVLDTVSDVSRARGAGAPARGARPTAPPPKHQQ